MKLNEPYSREDFIGFLGDFLPDFNADPRKVAVPSAAKTINTGQYIGRSAELDLDIFELEHAGGQEKRIALTTDGFRVMRESATFQALVVFKTTDTEQWRLSLMTSTPELSEGGKIVSKLSNPKRYSFLLGPDAKTNTPARFLIEKGRVDTFDELKERFSIEVVNKDFYRQIAKFFNRLTGGVVKFGAKTETFRPELKLPQEKVEKTELQEFAVRLIGRIIFSWFLKQKRSTAGVSLLPESFLSVKGVASNSNYYHEVLEKIFFEAMNKPLNVRQRDLPEAYNQIPFLNGGLFDPHPDDYYTDSQSSEDLLVPDSWFKELFEVLETYNFTIDENTAMDVELSIDPEMLGRIFENLLAEINPETGESARKSTGSFYTPRQIVDYMVDQSLIQYLLTKTGIDEKKLSALISVDELDDEDSPLTEEERGKIVDALDEVKILDPACGSGAFPMGILQKIVFILSRTDTNGKLWFAKKTAGLDLLLHEDFKKKFENENFDYIRKTGIIRDNIYGVDIQPIAVEVSKLRCFLTLVVDEDIDDDADNRGVKPLPNLEFKFVAANSLLKLPGYSGSREHQIAMFEEENQIGQLKKIRERYFVSSGTDKDKIKMEFYRVQKVMLDNQLDSHHQGFLTRELARWDPFADRSSPWFDPEWMFGVNDGFDIVIGNPPYLQIQKLSGQTIQKKYQDVEYYSFNKMGDLYCLFYERGLEVSKKGTGLLCYITSNKWMRAGYGEKLRDFFVTKHPLKLLDFGGFRVFESATVDTNIFMIKNDSNSIQLEACRFGIEYRKSFDLRTYFETNKVLLPHLTKQTWFIGSKDDLALKAKVELIGTPLKDWDVTINRGIITGLNEAFIIDQAKRDDLVASDPKSTEIIKPILRGRDIKKYSYMRAGLYVIIAKFGSYKTLESEYPAVYKHLLRFKDRLQKRGQCRYSRQAETQTGAAYLGQHHWLELDNNPHDDYLGLFEKEKVVWIELVNDGRFSYAEPGLYLNNTMYMMTGLNIKYHCGLLNSSLINWYFDTICTESGAGTNRWIKIYTNQIPIPRISDKNKEVGNNIVDLVDKIIQSKKKGPGINTADLEDQIDDLVFQLYGLSPKEISIIKGRSSKQG